MNEWMNDCLMVLQLIGWITTMKSLGYTKTMTQTERKQWQCTYTIYVTVLFAGDDWFFHHKRQHSFIHFSVRHQVSTSIIQLLYKHPNDPNMRPDNWLASIDDILIVNVLPDSSGAGILRYIGTGQLVNCRTPGSFLSCEHYYWLKTKLLTRRWFLPLLRTPFDAVLTIDEVPTPFPTHWRTSWFYWGVATRFDSSTSRRLVRRCHLASRRRAVPQSGPWRTSRPSSRDSYVACCLRLHC